MYDAERCSKQPGGKPGHDRHSTVGRIYDSGRSERGEAGRHGHLEQAGRELRMEREEGADSTAFMIEEMG